MKRFYESALYLSVVITIVFGCATPQPQRTRPLFSPSKLQVDQYQQKVDSFVVILDTSSSMSNKFSGYSKFRIAKDYLNALNHTIPELEYEGALRTFINIASASDKANILTYGPTRYSTAGFESAIRDVKGPIKDDSIPLAEAISATGKDLEASNKTSAVILLSDGINIDQKSLTAVTTIKNQFGDRICIYPIRIGDDSTGIKQMEKITETGACGFPVVVVDHKTSYSMGDLVEDIFLTKKEKSVPESVPIAKPLDSDGDGVPDNKDQCPDTPKGATVDERGCWSFESVVLFDFDSTKIRPEARPVLDEAAGILKINPDINVEIEGHTDIIGTAEYNMDLSERRANSVKEYFVSKGINAKRLTTKGYGLTRPVASNKTKEGRSKNRRVELTILK